MWSEQIRTGIQTLLHQSRQHRVGASDVSFVDQDGRVWVEVSSCAGKIAHTKGLKLRIIHLHPDNPALTETVNNHKRALQRSKQKNAEVCDTFIPDNVSLSSQEDFWFNHWQGPPIAPGADTGLSGQRGTSTRTSYRHCPVCQRKVKVATTDEDTAVLPASLPFPDSPLPPHLPSIRRSQIKLNPPSPATMRPSSPSILPSAVLIAEDEKPYKQAFSLSRMSASDEQLSRVARVLEHELRTSLDMFADDALDGATQTVCANESLDVVCNKDFLKLPESNHLEAGLSRSLPCSPRRPRKMQLQSSQFAGDQEAKAGAPASSKFYLSGSLLALHKPVSGTLSSQSHKMDKNTGSHKLLSWQSSIKLKKKEQCELRRKEECDAVVKVNAATEIVKFEKEDSKHSSSFSRDSSSSDNLSNMTSVLSEHSTGQSNSLTNDLPSKQLPDIKVGFVNLGYEHGESSDFVQDDANDALPLRDKLSNTTDENKIDSQLDSSPPVSISVLGSTTERKSSIDSQNSEENSNSCISLDSLPTSEASSSSMPHASSAPSTAPCSPSALRIRVMADKPGQPTLAALVQSQQHRAAASADSNQAAKGVLLRKDSILPGFRDNDIKLFDNESSSIVPEKNLSSVRSSVHSGKLIDRRSRPLPPYLQQMQQQHSLLQQQQTQYEFEFSEEVMTNMEEARSLVYWWRDHQVEDFCTVPGHCAVKSRPLLMFVHGVGGSADDWYHQLWYFVANGYEVVAPDLLGHGYSSTPDSASCYRFHRLLQHLCQLFDLFVPPGKKCVLIGHGYGCSLVSALSRCRPSSVPLLAMASCGGPSPLIPLTSSSNTSNGKQTHGSSSIHPYFRMAPCCGLELTDETHDRLDVLSCPTAIVRESGLLSALRTILSTACWLVCCFPFVFTRRDTAQQSRGKQLSSGALSSPGATATPPHVLRHIMRGQRWLEGDAAFHRRLTVPVLLLHGLKDTSVPLLHMCDMEKTIPRAFLEVVNSGGHYLISESPKEVNAALHRFIKRWQRLLV